MFIIAIIIISVAILFGGIHKIGEGHVVTIIQLLFSQKGSLL